MDRAKWTHFTKRNCSTETAVCSRSTKFDNHTNVVHDSSQTGEVNVTIVQTCLRPNQEDASIQGVKTVTNVETSKVQSFCTYTTLNVTNVATSSVSVNNYVEEPHDTGEKESFCT